MKRIAIIIAALALCGALAGTAQAKHTKPDTFVKRGKVRTVEFGPGQRAATAEVRCPANASLTMGYVSIVYDGTPFGTSVAAEDVTTDEQGWEVTVVTDGLYRAGEDVSTAKFIANVICIR